MVPTSHVVVVVLVVGLVVGLVVVVVTVHDHGVECKCR